MTVVERAQPNVEGHQKGGEADRDGAALRVAGHDHLLVVADAVHAMHRIEEEVGEEDAYP